MGFFFDQIPYVLTVSGVFVAAMLFSCVVVGRVLRNDEIKDKVMSEENVAEMKKRLEQKKYEQSFYDKLEALDDIDLTKADMKKLAEVYVMEDTPSGAIKMCYSYETETFWYYSANKNISYPTLDAVARKFAIEHNCAQICVNYRKEIEKLRKKCDKKASDNLASLVGRGLLAAAATDNTPSPYVKLKSYNITGANKSKNPVTVERSNRFTFKGKIEENNDNVKPDIQKISFAEFKKTMELEKHKTS